MSANERSRARRISSSLLRALLVVVLIVAGLVIGAEFELFTNIVRENIALLTNSRLPETSIRLEYLLTTHEI